LSSSLAPSSQGAHIKELIAELKEMFPTPDADDLQADFLE